MNFRSDNVAGAAPEILQALVSGMAGAADPYGDDVATARVQARLSDIFETEVAAFPVATGSAANALALSCLTPPYGAVYCHAASHIQVDECGAPELFTGGAKLVPLDGVDGKIQLDDLNATLAAAGAGVVHHVQPAVLSLTQLTEAGTAYTPDELVTLTAVARRHDLSVHMDGARFANALASLGGAPADLTWRAGVDVLSLGATKNGCLAAEAVVFFKPEQAREFAFRRKRGGHLFSKMRALSLQLDAYLADGLWLDLAQRANRQATRLAEGLAGLPGAALRFPVDGNELFIELPEPVIAGLEAAGFRFYRWQDGVVRLVTAFDTDPAAVDRLVAEATRLSSAVRRSA